MEHRFTAPGLTIDDGEKIAAHLQERLDALVDLALVLKHVHWNVVGPGFIAVHEMLDDHVAQLRTMADEIAERIATLGAVPNGLAGMLVQRRTWDDYSLGRAVVPAHLGALDKAYEGTIASHRNAIEAIEPVDVVTADLLTAQTGKLELIQWFVRAHLETTSGELPTSGEATEIGAAVAAATTDHLQ